MPGRPKERRLKTKLAEIAKREIGPHATSVDWVARKVADGVTMGNLAEYVAGEMKESISRSFLSWHINNVTPDAKERISAARKEATHVWAEQALDIPEPPATITAEVLQARLQIETQRPLAAVLNRDECSSTKLRWTKGPSILQHSALELPSARRSSHPKAEIISETILPALLESGEAQRE